jgi:hypothetical protein
MGAHRIELELTLFGIFGVCIQRQLDLGHNLCHEHVVAAMDTLQRAGIARVGLHVRVE